MLAAAELVVAAADEELASVVSVEDAVDAAVTVEEAVSMVTLESTSLAEVICVATDESALDAKAILDEMAPCADVIASVGAEIAEEPRAAAAKDADWRDADAELSGPIGTGRSVGRSLIVVASEDSAEGTFEASDAIVEAAFDAADATSDAAFDAAEATVLMADSTAEVTEPATLEATVASWDAADWSCDWIEAASVAAEETIAGVLMVGTMTLTGAMEIGSVGMEAVAGRRIDVVNPFTTTGAIGPGVSEPG